MSRIAGDNITKASGAGVTATRIALRLFRNRAITSGNLYKTRRDPWDAAATPTGHMHSVSRIASKTTASSPSGIRITTRAYSIRSRLRANMASATRIVIKAEDTGFWKAKQDEETAAKNHHVFFNAAGFHNHLVHQLLALYGTGAPESAIQAAFDANAGYQLKHTPARPHVVAELQADWAAHAPKYLGRGAYYSDFLRFFQDEVDRRGWQAVVAAFLCAPGDAASPARHMVQRLFSGLVHPMIQLGFGLEWEQPAI
ncbi:hypothetical protein H633G_10056, partial [Metarhizium anisopliae BRIP 53284]